MKKTILILAILLIAILLFGCTQTGLNDICPDGSISITGECIPEETDQIETNTPDDNAIQTRQSKSISKTTETNEEEFFNIELAPITKKCYNSVNTITRNNKLICLEDSGYTICTIDAECGNGFECFDEHCFEEKTNTHITSLECLENDTIGANCGGGKLTSKTIVTTTLYEEDQWANAETTCKNLDNGYNDWRLPTKEEIADAYTIIGDRGYVWMNTTQDACTLRSPQRCGLGYKTYETHPFICIRETQKRQLLKEEEPYIPEIFPGPPQPPDGVTVIGTCQDLQDIRTNPNGNYLLDFDIDCTDFAFEPITKFNGTLDGDDWEITNLKINSNEEAAIFKFISYKATIKNLTITDIEITSAEDAAGLAVESVGKLENIKLTGTIKGKIAGGITTFNHGYIHNSQVIAKVQSYTGQAGMITADNQGAITNTEFDQPKTNILALATTTNATACNSTGILSQSCTQIIKDPICDTSNNPGIGSDSVEGSIDITGEIPELSDKGNELYHHQRGNAISSEFSALEGIVYIYVPNSTSIYDLPPIKYKLRNNDKGKYIKTGIINRCKPQSLGGSEHYECEVPIYRAQELAWNVDVQRKFSYLKRHFLLKHKWRNLQLELYYEDIESGDVCLDAIPFTSEHANEFKYTEGYGGEASKASVYPLLQLNFGKSTTSERVTAAMRGYMTYFRNDPIDKDILFAFNMPYYSLITDTYTKSYGGQSFYHLFRDSIPPIYRRVIIESYLSKSKSVTMNSEEVDFSHLLLGVDARHGTIADNQLWYDGIDGLFVIAVFGNAALHVDATLEGLRLACTVEKSLGNACPTATFWDKLVKVKNVLSSYRFSFTILDEWAKTASSNMNSPDILGDWYGAILNRRLRGSQYTTLPDKLDATIPTLPRYEPKAKELDNCYDNFVNTFSNNP